MKILVIGAGIFGCSVALELDKYNQDVTLMERDFDILCGATKNNHNRIHFGYHYPRSNATALQSLGGLKLFLEYYDAAIVSNFDNYYAIAKKGSKITTKQYMDFCDEIGLDYKLEYPSRKYLNRKYVDSCFKVNESIYDIDILRKIIKERLGESNVTVKLNSPVLALDEADEYDYVINCSYDNTNEIAELFGVDQIVFDEQSVVIPIVEMESLERVGLTIMDGDFCTIMPQGYTPNTFLFYHVKHSVIRDFNKSIQWYVDKIMEECGMYYPIFKDAKYKSYYLSKRCIPYNMNDERLSKIITYPNNSKLISIFAGKVSTAIDMAKQVVTKLKLNNLNKNIYI